MAVSYKILGQVANAITEQTLYTVPASTSAKVRVTVNNREATSATFTVVLIPNGGTTADKDHIATNKNIPANETKTSVTFTLDAADEIKVTSSTSTVTFTAYGAERV